MPAGGPLLLRGDVVGQPVIDLRCFWARMRAAAGIPDVPVDDPHHASASLLVSGRASLEVITQGRRHRIGGNGEAALEGGEGSGVGEDGTGSDLRMKPEQKRAKRISQIMAPLPLHLSNPKKTKVNQRDFHHEQAMTKGRSLTQTEQTSSMVIIKSVNPSEKATCKLGWKSSCQAGERESVHSAGELSQSGIKIAQPRIASDIFLIFS